jgi:hypothetical protein
MEFVENVGKGVTIVAAHGFACDAFLFDPYVSAFNTHPWVRLNYLTFPYPVDADMDVIKQFMANLSDIKLREQVKEISKSGLGENLNKFAGDSPMQAEYRRVVTERLSAIEGDIVLVAHSFGVGILLDCLNTSKLLRGKVVGFVALAPILCNWKAFKKHEDAPVLHVIYSPNDPFHAEALMVKACEFLADYYQLNIDRESKSVPHMMKKGGAFLKSLL